jgi:ribosomal-protein-alanine N-acetyltransferase
MRWRDARAVARWRYDGIYAFYNVGFVSLLVVMLTQQALRLFGSAFYFSVLEADGALAGIFSFVRHSDTLEVGLGMRPDRTGHGEGLAFVLAGLEFARQRFNPRGFRLNVVTFNERARKVYQRAGFTPVRTFTRWTNGRPYEHLEMARDA